MMFWPSWRGSRGRKGPWRYSSAFALAATPIRGEMARSGQASHLGFRATHQRRPCWIMRWLKATHSPPRHRRHEVLLDLHRVLLAREPQAAAQPRHVGIDHDSRGKTEGGAEDDVGRLAPHAGKVDQLLELIRHPAFVLLDQYAAGGLDVFGLVAEEAGALHGLFQFGQRGGGEMGRIGVLAKQRRRDHVHPLVGALGREDRRHQQFQRRPEVQRALGLRVLAPQGADYLGGVSLGFIGGGHHGTPREESLDTSGCPAAKAHFGGRGSQFSSPPAPDVK